MQNRHTHEDGTPFTKEEFLQKLKTDKKFNDEFGNKGIDQISELIRLLKETPDSRRMVVNAWAVHDLPKMTLPPCHYGFQVYTRELTWEERFDIHKKYITEDKLDLVFELATNENLDKLGVPTRAISLMWNQRSVDTFLGLPFNIASYGLLLEIIAKAVNMVPDELIGNLGDTHLYSNHIEQAKEQIGRAYTLEEREAMLKDAMSWRLYNKAVNELMPFGGGMSEYYETHKIPYHTREPYPLPKLILDDWYSTQGDPSNTAQDISNFLKDINIAHISIENYQSHPTIKAPLSN